MVLAKTNMDIIIIIKLIIYTMHIYALVLWPGTVEVEAVSGTGGSASLLTFCQMSLQYSALYHSSIHIRKFRLNACCKYNIHNYLQKIAKLFNKSVNEKILVKL